MEKTVCSFPECDRKNHAKQLCKKHYEQLRLTGAMKPIRSPHGGVDPKSEDRLREEFWLNVRKSDGCWLWKGSKAQGYGRMKFRKKTILAHRYSWEFHCGPIPIGKVIDHLCHVTDCVNPSHLRLASPEENAQNRRGAASHSKSGIRGVWWDGKSSSWVGSVNVSKTRIRRRFQDVEDARKWVEERREELYR